MSARVCAVYSEISGEQASLQLVNAPNYALLEQQSYSKGIISTNFFSITSLYNGHDGKEMIRIGVKSIKLNVNL